MFVKNLQLLSKKFLLPWQEPYLKSSMNPRLWSGSEIHQQRSNLPEPFFFFLYKLKYF